MTIQQTNTGQLPTWVLVLLVLFVLGIIAWNILMEVGRMGFFWGWWGR